MKRLTLCLMLALSSPALGAGTLVYGASGEPTSLESGNVNDTGSALAQAQIYDTLLHFKPGTTQAEPGLALRWASNANASEWTFYLRQNVKFHDGTPFNADALLFNLNRWWDPKDPNGLRDAGRTWQSWARAFGGFKGDANGLVTAIRKDGPYRVTITLNKPFADFPEVLSSAFFGIASPAAVKKAGDKYGTPAGGAVGTGPFQFVSWTGGDRLNLRPYAGYWDGPSKLDALTFRFIKDPSARLNELRAGAVDFVSDLTPDDLPAIRANKQLAAVAKPSFNVGFLSLNTKHPALSSDKVRQAVHLALNKKELVNAFYGELGVSDNSFLPPALRWANSRRVALEPRFDPAAAKKLLADAGFPNGFAMDLWYMPVSRPYFPNPKPIAEAMAADLGAIGIRVTLKTEDWAAYLQDRYKKGFDAYMIGWTPGNGSPYDFYSAYYGPFGSSDSGYQPKALDSLLDAAQAATSRAQKVRVYGQINEITAGANVRLPIVHSSPLGARRSYVQGWTPSPLGTESFAPITVEGK